MGYTTQPQIESYLQRTLSEQEIAIFELINNAAKAIIDRYTGKSFTPDTESSDRYYDGFCNFHIEIDNCIKVDEVAFLDWQGNQTQLLEEGVDFDVVPYNTLPINAIRVRNFKAYRGDRSVRVKAQWGSSEEIPADVSLVALQLVSGVYSNPQGIKSQSIEGYSVSMDGTMPSDTKALLESLGQSVYVL